MTMSKPVQSENGLPNSIAGRIVLGLLCILFLPFSVIFLFALFIGGVGANWGDLLVRFLFGEFLLALFMVSGCGVIWAIAMPKWIITIMHHWSGRLALLLFIPFLLMAAMLFWPI